MANRVTTVFDAVDRGLSDAVNRLKRSIGEADTATGKLKAGWQGVVAEFKNSREAQVAAAGAVGAVAVKAINDYSNLNESVNAVTVQYGLASDAVLELGEDSAESFGMSKRAFNEFSVGFSAFANQIAQNSGQQVQDVVGEMATRIADFASVHNLSLEEAEQVAKSTLAGETEAFRRFGGDVSAATVTAYAYQTGIAEVGQELTEGQKVLARYNLFMDQTNKTQGDFANTSDGLANQQRILQAKVEDLSASLGEQLYPAAQDAASSLMAAADAAMFLKDAVDDVKKTMPGWLREPTEAAFKFGRTVVDPVYAVGQLDNKLKDVFGSGEDAATAMNDLADADKAATTSANRVAAAQEEAAEQTRIAGEYAEYAEGYKQAMAQADEDAARAAEEAAEAAERQNDVLAEQVRTTEELIDRKIELIGGDIAVRNAQRDAKAAGEELNAVLEDQESTLEDAAVAIDNATEANLNAAEAAAQYEIDQREANGETLTARDRANIYRDSLQELAGQLDGPVRDAILNYIATLDKIPSEKTTIITATGARVGVTSGGAKRPAPGGGAQSMTQGFAPTAGAPGGTVINMVVNAGMGTDGRQVGRQIKEALAAYERGGGR